MASTSAHRVIINVVVYVRSGRKDTKYAFRVCKWFSPQVFCLYRALTLSCCERPQASEGEITAQFCFSFKALSNLNTFFCTKNFSALFSISPFLAPPFLCECAWQREMEMFITSPSRAGFLCSRAISRYLLI